MAARGWGWYCGRVRGVGGWVVDATAPRTAPEILLLILAFAPARLCLLGLLLHLRLRARLCLASTPVRELPPGRACIGGKKLENSGNLLRRPSRGAV